MASIDERIAELEQRIAEKKAYQRMYRPNRNMAAWDYVAEGDRSGYDKIDASEAAYHNMLRQQEQQKALLEAQQKFTAKENDLNRKNAINLAMLNKDEQTKYRENEIANKYQLALQDYELAQQQVDMQKPETIARLKRAAQLVNHYGSQLSFDSVSSDVTEDAEPIKINKAIAKVKALKRTKPAKWTDEQKQVYVDNMALVPDEDERKADLQGDLTNMPLTTEEQKEARNKRKAKWEAGKKLTGFDYRSWKESPEGKALINEFGE